MLQARKILFGILRTAAAIVVALLALAAGVQILTVVRERPLATMKIWPVLNVPALGNAGLALRTTWKDGRIYYQFAIESETELQADGADPTITIEFSDKDGFTVLKQAVPLNEFTRLVDSGGRPTGLGWKSDVYADAAVYRQLAKWTVAWRDVDKAGAPRNPIDSVLSAPPSVPKWKQIASWRNLHRGMTADSVRVLLGEPTKIDAYSSFSVWHYGYPFGGDVTVGRDGTVDAWSEPSH